MNDEVRLLMLEKLNNIFIEGTVSNVRRMLHRWKAAVHRHRIFTRLMNRMNKTLFGSVV